MMTTRLEFSRIGLGRLPTICAALLASTSICLSLEVQITNPGFESDWDGWDDTDPSAISSEAHSGAKAAKTTGAGARFEQTITLPANSDCELSAWVKGDGVIGIKGGASTSTSSKSYKKVSVAFSTGKNESITIYGEHGASGEARFDDFTVTIPDGTQPSPPNPSTDSSPPKSTSDPSPSRTDDSSPAASDDTTYPSQVLDLAPWKLNIPFDKNGSDSGTPSDWDDRNTKSHQIDKLDNYKCEKDGVTYFGVNATGDAVVFRAHATGATTGGSQYPRSELRQLMQIDGKWKNGYWQGTKHQKMYLKGKITATPSSKPEVVIAQIHAKGSKADDTLKVGYDHDQKLIYVTYVDSNFDKHVTHPIVPGTHAKPGIANPDAKPLGYTLGDELEITVENKRPGSADYEVDVIVNNLSTGKGITLNFIQAKDTSGYYFKAGCYTQSRYLKDDMFLYPLKSGTEEAATAYGETEISVLELTTNL